DARAEWRIGARDLDALLGLDSDHDGRLSDPELAAGARSIAGYLVSRLELEADGAACGSTAHEQTLENGYLHLALQISCPTEPRRFGLRYDAVFDHDPNHVASATLVRGGLTQTRLFTASERHHVFELGPVRRATLVREYIAQGVFHIWTGYDHVLFLLTLLLPAVLLRWRDQWIAAPRLRPALSEVIKVVSAFTLAHSLTLALAALELVQLPSRWVEAIIAASIVLAALNNVFGWVGERTWLIAFGFGLIHGFGFASVLSELNVPKPERLIALIAFNVGVELGQLAIVLGYVPLAWRLRRSHIYVRYALHGGSWFIATLGMYWVLERSYDLSQHDIWRALLLAAPDAWPALVGASTALLLALLARQRRSRRLLTIAALSGIVSVVSGAYLVATQRATLRHDLGLQLEAASVARQRRAWTSAEAPLVRASQLAKALDDTRAEADIANRLGALYSVRGDLARARAEHERALSLYTAQRDDRACASTQRALAVVAQLEGDTPRAARAYRQALALHEQLGLHEPAASDASELGALYWHSHQYNEATAAYEHSRSLLQQLGQAERAQRIDGINARLVELQRAALRAARR
ncbi:MAG: HupE/UreJ family protein, partial [Polyangiales bacterium]